MRISDTLRMATLIWIGLMGFDELHAGTKKRGAMIVSPKRDAVVHRTQEVIGKLHVPGQPVVLIKPLDEVGPWWVQPVTRPSERGYFKVEVRFGTAEAQPGERFALTIVVLQSRSDVEWLQNRETVPELPAELWQSEAVQVVLGAADKPDHKTNAIASTILKPRNFGKVQRVTEVAGRVTLEHQPVVLVRDVNGDGLWWAQESAKLDSSGNFTARARFGNAATPHGTKFEVVVIAPRTLQQANEFPVGATLRELPDGIPRSKSITVELEKIDLTRG